MKLNVPAISRVTGKNRILDVALPFTKGVFKDTREQAEKLYGALIANGATIEMVKEDVGESANGFGSIRQFVNVTACGHLFKLVCVHCLCDVGTKNAYGDLCFYSTE